MLVYLTHFFFNSVESEYRQGNYIFQSLKFVHILAVNKNFTDIAKLLIEINATDLNIRDSDDQTPLMKGI